MLKLKTYNNGNREWFNAKGQSHREDGPAVEYTRGYKAWYFNGKRHRLNGPAVERSNGDREWWVNDKLHRLDGPAIERSNGDREWWVNGKQYIEEEYYAQIKNR